MTVGLSRRNILALGGGAALAMPFVRRASAQTRTIYVSSYGGAWDTAWKKAFFDPFTAETKIRVSTVPGTSFAKLKAQVQARKFEWNVAIFGDVEYTQAAHEGLLETVDKVAARVDRLPPEIVRECGIGCYSLGDVIVYRKDKFPNGGPQSWADFWDVKRFPGARAMRDRPATCLAFALLADGVPLDKLYPMDIDRGFRKLSELKPHVKVWWTQGAQSQQLIRDGDVDMIAMWSARAVDLIEDNVPVEMVWNGAAIYDAYVLVPKGDPNAKAAWEFCGFIAQAKPQADFAMLLPYGPVNPGARSLMTDARLRQTPAWPQNEKVSFRHDTAWLAPRMPEIQERWSQWLSS